MTKLIDMKVLVTGATGFVGSHLAKALAGQGAELTCLVRPNSATEPLAALGARCLPFADITDLQAIRQAVAGQQVVFHVAGRVTAVKPAQYYQTNVEGTRCVAQACAEQDNPPVLVLVSSLAAAGPAVDHRPRTEDDPPQPVSHYGRSKLAAELAAASFGDRAPVTVVRPCIVFGQGDRATLDMFRSVARYRIHLIPGFSRHRYSLIHVSDLADLLVRAACRGRRIPAEVAEAVRRGETKTSGKGVYFAAYPQHLSYWELGGLIAEAANTPWVCFTLVPMPIVWLVAGVGTAVSKWRSSPVYLNLDKAREIAAGSWICSPQKAMAELGFCPTVSPLQRLKETVVWYRAHGWL